MSRSADVNSRAADYAYKVALYSMPAIYFASFI